jgi:hypothetical protein
MAAVDFPATLPKVDMKNYSYKTMDQNIRTDMEVGLARVRRRFLASPMEIRVTWELTAVELGIFEKFYETDINAGASWFNIPVVNGAGETIVEARFKEPPSVGTSAKEFAWKVNAVLETIDRPLIP